MVMDMDGKTVRVDNVDFSNDAVGMTDITDKQHPIAFREKPSIVRSYVEAAPAEQLLKAFERQERRTKKPSVLAKLKDHTQSAPERQTKTPERAKKPKSKEMEI